MNSGSPTPISLQVVKTRAYNVPESVTVTGVDFLDFLFSSMAIYLKSV